MGVHLHITQARLRQKITAAHIVNYLQQLTFNMVSKTLILITMQWTPTL